MAVTYRNKFSPWPLGPCPETLCPQTPTPQSHPRHLPSSVERGVRIWIPESFQLTDGGKRRITVLCLQNWLPLAIYLGTSLPLTIKPKGW